MYRMKKLIAVIVGIIVIVALVVVFVKIIPRVSAEESENNLNEQLDLGQPYLDELHYEQALVTYQSMLEIEEKNADAYIGMVDVYISMGDMENARKYAKRGYEATADERLLEKLQQIAVVLGEEEEENIEQEPETEIESKAEVANPEDIEEGVFEFENKLTEDGISVDAKYLTIRANNSTGEVVITLYGLHLWDQYTVNQVTSEKDILEYSWTISMYGKQETYVVGTYSWAFNPGYERKESLSKMQQSVFRQNEGSASLVADAKIQHTEDNITWTFYLPEDAVFDFAEVEKYVVSINYGPEDIYKTREYVNSNN